MQIRIVVACAFVWAAAATGVARAQDAGTAVTCKDGTAGTAGRGACSHHGGVAKAGATATAPAATAPAPAAAAPAASTGAAVTCKDGSSGTAGRGACSHHGGVATTSSAGAVAPAAPAPAAAAPAAPAPAATKPTTSSSKAATTTGTNAGKSGTSETTDATGAIAQCKDGLYSHSKTHTGTCSRHGGVAKWLDGSAP
jgi:hypothetical protein